MTEVFISYSSTDVGVAEKIELSLQAAGFDVWRDKRMIEADWSKEIADALSKSDAILVIWSENSSISNWVKNEWLTARALGKPIIPVIISDPSQTPLPKPLINIESMVLKNDIGSSTQMIIDKLGNSEKIKHKEYDYNILPSKRNIPSTSS